jgi:hypothetical protein
MGRDFSYKIITSTGKESGWDELYWARNTVEPMCERDFTYAELKEYIQDCLIRDDIEPLKALVHVLNEMNQDETVIINSG